MDHKSLEYIKTAKHLNSRQARWVLFFSSFNFFLSYHPGSRNGKPDAVSRHFEKEGETSKPDTILPSQCVITTDKFSGKQDVLEALCQYPSPSNKPRRKLLSLCLSIPRWAYASRLACHPGVSHMVDSVRLRLWWPSHAG